MFSLLNAQCSRRRGVSLPVLLFLLCTLSLAGCRSVPVTDRTQLLLTSSDYENRLGAEAYAEYKAQYPRSTNAGYNQALERCGRAIVAVAGQNDFDWEFIVLNSSTQNAFCLPGGKVAVYSGIMDLMNNEAELAFVVAHEIGHAIARHSGERMSWGYLQSLGGLLVAIGFQNDTINGVYGTGTELGVMLPFSRSNETEADLIGLLLMAKAGYNPRASVQFWTRFSGSSQAGVLGNLMSTHPCDSDRIAEMNRNMSRADEEYRKCANPKGYGTVFQHNRSR